MEAFQDLLVIDRTQADVLARNQKGTYNAADLNRVDRAAAYIARRLWEYGYGVAPPESQAYLVAVDVSPPGSGASVGGLYYRGETAAVNAVPAGESRFVGWMEDGAMVSEDAEYSFPVGSDRTLTAVFEPQGLEMSGTVGIGTIGAAIVGRGLV